MKDNLGKGNTNDAEHIDSVQLQFCWAQLAATAVEKKRNNINRRAVDQIFNVTTATNDSSIR